MPFYALYATFDKKTTDFLAGISEKVQTKFGKYLKTKITEFPHITVAFGPELTKEPELKVYSNDGVENIYPGFIGKFEGQLPALKTSGVGIFDRKELSNQYILKVQFESELLTKMRHEIYRSSDELINLRIKSEKQICNVKGDESWAELPKKWAHCTLAVFNATDDLPLDEIIGFALSLLKKFPDSVKTHSIELISAITDTRVKLW